MFSKCGFLSRLGANVAMPAAGISVAFAPQQLRDRQRSIAKCDIIDGAVIALGFSTFTVVGSAMALSSRARSLGTETAQRANGGRTATRSTRFEHRVKTAYQDSQIGRAVLASAPSAHPALVKLAEVETTMENINDTVLAITGHIRSAWEDVLAEIVQLPRSNDAIPTEDEAFCQAAADGVRVTKVQIPLLERSETAKKLGLHTLAKVLDRNADGAIDFQEFSTLVFFHAEFVGAQKGFKRRSNAQVYKLLYAILDANGDGRVTREEFESFMVMACKLGIAHPCQTQMFSSLWASHAWDGNELMTYEEFLACAHGTLDLSGFHGELPLH